MLRARLTHRAGEHARRTGPVARQPCNPCFGRCSSCRKCHGGSSSQGRTSFRSREARNDPSGAEGKRAPPRWQDRDGPAGRRPGHRAGERPWVCSAAPDSSQNFTPLNFQNDTFALPAFGSQHSLDQNVLLSKNLTFSFSLKESPLPGRRSTGRPGPNQVVSVDAAEAGRKIPPGSGDKSRLKGIVALRQHAIHPARPIAVVKDEGAGGGWFAGHVGVADSHIMKDAI